MPWAGGSHFLPWVRDVEPQVHKLAFRRDTASSSPCSVPAPVSAAATWLSKGGAWMVASPDRA